MIGKKIFKAQQQLFKNKIKIRKQVLENFKMISKKKKKRYQKSKMKDKLKLKKSKRNINKY